MQNELFPEGAVLVVGGSGGIGQFVCREFARSGTDVALTYQSKADVATTVADDIRALGRSASVHQLRVGDAAQVAAVVDAAAQQHGRIHTVVYAVGSIAEQVLISDLTVEQWNTVLNQDLTGFLNVVRATLPKLRAWGGGSYVNLGTGANLNWVERDVMSATPKAAIESLISGIAKEEGRNGIRANSVLLGVIEAGMFLELQKRGAFSAEWTEEVQKTLALKRWGKPEEIAYAAVFLASSRAAYITGHRIPVTGGYAI
jgi:NAD(P)-dependent dehydrogenase (short-subunit alcohol dehydrogenase family)